MKPTLNDSQVSWNKGSRCKKKGPGPINEGNVTRTAWTEVCFETINYYKCFRRSGEDGFVNFEYMCIYIFRYNLMFFRPCIIV